MTTNADPVRHAQGVLAAAVRRGRDQIQPRRALTGAKLRGAVQRALDDDFPPTDEDRRAIAALLTGGVR